MSCRGGLEPGASCPAVTCRNPEAAGMDKVLMLGLRLVDFESRCFASQLDCTV